MLSTDFVSDSTFFRKKRKWWPKEGRGIGGKVNMWLSVASYMKVGPYRFKNVPTIVFDDAHNVTSYPYLGGIIGNDILRRFNVIYNYAEKEIHLLPNTHFKDPFDYSYTGTELLYSNGHILIGTISPNSPAESAGLQEDDVVLAINNLFNNNFDQYKKEFQKISKGTKLIINREGKLLEIIMNVRSIR
jgi:S1-C subfamily serine protease